MNKKLAYFIATMFGVGYCPVAPGTAGSLATMILAIFVAYNFGAWGIIIASIVVLLFGAIAVKEVIKHTKHDPSFVVIDETVGQLLSFALVGNFLVGKLDGQAMALYVLGFVLFRIFDILKPNPVGWADKKLENEWGIMLDDVFAGVYATILLYLFSGYFFMNI